MRPSCRRPRPRRCSPSRRVGRRRERSRVDALGLRPSNRQLAATAAPRDARGAGRCRARWRGRSPTARTRSAPAGTAGSISPRRPARAVRAACSGVVVTARPGVVTLRCGPWRVTHLPLGSVSVAVGASVRAGRVVGTVGASGEHRGLHLGVRREGDRFAYVDPLPFLTGRTTAPPTVPPPRTTRIPRSGPGSARPSRAAVPAPRVRPPRVPGVAARGRAGVAARAARVAARAVPASPHRRSRPPARRAAPRPSRLAGVRVSSAPAARARARAAGPRGSGSRCSCSARSAVRVRVRVRRRSRGAYAAGRGRRGGGAAHVRARAVGGGRGRRGRARLPRGEDAVQRVPDPARRRDRRGAGHAEAGVRRRARRDRLNPLTIASWAAVFAAASTAGATEGYAVLMLLAASASAA